MAPKLKAKCAERDELLSWLETLEEEEASPEAIALVQGQLERVLHDIARLKGIETAGFSLSAAAGQ